MSAKLSSGRIAAASLRTARPPGLRLSTPARPRRTRSARRSKTIFNVQPVNAEYWETAVIKSSLPVLVYFENTFGENWKELQRDAMVVEDVLNKTEFVYPGVKMVRIQNTSNMGVDVPLGLTLHGIKGSFFVVYQAGTALPGSVQELPPLLQPDGPKPLLPFLGKPASQTFEERLAAYLQRHLKGKASEEPVGGRQDLRELKEQREASAASAKAYSDNIKAQFLGSLQFWKKK